jgi:hypothetical protein
MHSSSFVLNSLSLLFLSFAIGDNERVKGKTATVGKHHRVCSEMNFKFWLQPGTEECYHQLLESGSSLYLMYEMLNTQSSDGNVLVYLRNAYNGNVVASSNAPERAHLEFATNESSKLIERRDHLRDDNVI